MGLDCLYLDTSVVFLAGASLKTLRQILRPVQNADDFQHVAPASVKDKVAMKRTRQEPEAYAAPARSVGRDRTDERMREQQVDGLLVSLSEPTSQFRIDLVVTGIDRIRVIA